LLTLLGLLLLPFVLVVLLPASLVKMRRRGGYGAKFWQRFGVFDAATRARLEAGRGRAWWLHAVSVGEVNVARKLIGERLKVAPGDPVVLSVTTSTGYAVAVKDAPEALTVIYSPVDLLPVPGRLLGLIRPVVLVLVEAEVWPNLVWGARRRGIPVVLANARLSPRSERRYGKVRALVEPVFGLLTRVLVQDASDAARWASIGVPAERIVLSGSVKYDLAGAVREERVPEFRGILERVWGPGHPVILAAIVRSFAAWPARDVLPYLNRASYHNMVAAAAIATLKAQNRTDAVPAIVELLRKQAGTLESQDVAAALDAVASLSRETKDETVQVFLAEFLRSPRRGVAAGAARALGTLGDLRSAAVLRATRLRHRLRPKLRRLRLPQQPRLRMQLRPLRPWNTPP
jgi:hypothetical protein